jgi:hypothetical protein
MCFEQYFAKFLLILVKLYAGGRHIMQLSTCEIRENR